MTQSPPLISIITPTYNREEYLIETIESVLSQDHPNFEYIVIDDGSVDGTPEILHRYEQIIRCYRQNNRGEALSVNRGLELAKGQYIGVVNSDDPILPNLLNFVEKEFTEKPEVIAVYPDWAMIDSESNQIRRMRLPAYDYLAMIRRHKCYIGPGAFIHRRALELEFGRDPNFRYVGDFEYWRRLGLHGEFAHIPEVLATHRVHKGSTSSQVYVDNAAEHLQLVEKLFSRDDLPRNFQKLQDEAYSNAAYLAGRICMQSSMQAARRYFWISIERDIFAYLRWRPSRILMLVISFLPLKLAIMMKKYIEKFVNSPMVYYR